jgi:choline kinase
MQVIVLAAGQGSRLRPLTNTKPKCMVELLGKPLLAYQLELFNKLNLENVLIVGGYKYDKLDTQGAPVVINERFAVTNMVSTLFCAEEFISDEQDLLLTYGDIVYDQKVLEAIIADDSPCSVVIDKEWKQLWSLRMDNPLDDAETLKINKAGFITEIGKKPSSYQDIEGQYIGMIKIRADYVNRFKDAWKNMDSEIILDGQDKDNIYMTSFIQYLIDLNINFSPVYIDNGWLEIDTVEDLNAYEKLISLGTHKKIFKSIAVSN